MSEEKNLIKMRNYLKNLIVISIFGLTAISLYLGTVHRINHNFLLDVFIVNYGYIDVGDGCWRRNVLTTTLRCW